MALLESGDKDRVQAWHELQFEIVRKAKAEREWVPISEFSSAFGFTNWNMLESSNPGLPLAEAYVAVSYLVSEYGLKACVSIFTGAKSGSPGSALASNTGLTFAQLELAIDGWLSGMDAPPAIVSN